MLRSLVRSTACLILVLTSVNGCGDGAAVDDEVRAGEKPRSATITATGVGSIRLGQTAVTLRRQGLIGPLGPGCELAPGSRAAPLRGQLRGTATFADGTHLTVLVLTRGAMTRRGIGIGAPTSAVLASYPDSSYTRHRTAPLSGFITVPASGRSRMMFTIDHRRETVTGIAVPVLAFCE